MSERELCENMSAPLQYAISDFSTKNISIQKKRIEGNYRLHWHHCCEIEFVISGKGSQILNGTEYKLLPGTIYMLTPADCHSVRIDEPIEIAGIMFEDKLISRTIYERILTLETMGVDLTTRLEGEARRTAAGFFDALMCENGIFSNDMSENEFGDLYVSHLIDCLLIELLRHCGKNANRIDKSPIGTAILYLHSHYFETVTLDTLAALTHLSRNYFSELFRASTGSTFKKYLIELRLRQACRLLANTDMSVTDVCYASGFDSFSNFMRTFKGRYKITPLGFREENRIKKSEKMQQNQ